MMTTLKAEIAQLILESELDPLKARALVNAVINRVDGAILDFRMPYDSDEDPVHALASCQTLLAVARVIRNSEQEF